MRGRWSGVIVSAMLLTAVMVACGLPGTADDDENDRLFQVSTLDALLAGDYDGRMSYGDLNDHGDFGLGTFEALDGEMVAFDGEYFQVRADGRAYEVDDETLTPFAVVTTFNPQELGELDEVLSCTDLQTRIDGLIDDADAPVAISVEGSFGFVHTRSVEPQEEPYPTLEDALAGQIEFELLNVDGTIVGFRLPEYMAGANATGYHFHFIDDDHTSGGHVLDCETESVEIFYDEIDSWQVELGEE